MAEFSNVPGEGSNSHVSETRGDPTGVASTVGSVGIAVAETRRAEGRNDVVAPVFDRPLNDLPNPGTASTPSNSSFT